MSIKLLANPKALTNMVRRIALEAGAATLAHFDETGYDFAQGKADGSPVTIADQEAEALITKGLLQILPDVPVVAEEAAAAGHTPDITGAEYFWLVDPLDGTKEFVAGRPDYTVNIALIHGTKPFLGVVYAPALGVLYAGCGPNTALKWREDNGGDRSIRARKAPAAGLTVLASRSHARRQDLEAFLAQHKVEKVFHRGSSLKMCLIAEGKADLYPRLGPTSEWDTAAAQAILEAADGALVDLIHETPLDYGHAERGFINPYFIARGKI